MQLGIRECWAKWAPLAVWATALSFAQAAPSLTVNNGQLGLAQTPAATNDVWANPPSTDAVFDRWTGDTQLLADPWSWHTTAVMPTNAATVTATYKSSPTWPLSTNILNGLPPNNSSAIFLIYYFPQNPVGLVFRFHGTGGSAINFYQKVEDFWFARQAVAAGYAVAALDSTDRVNKKWDPAVSAKNVDVVNVQAAISNFVSLGLMTTNLPKFCIGMSDGGAFAPKPAYYLGFNACAIWCAAGSPPQAFNVTTAPTIWNLAYMDDQVDHTTFLAGSQTNFNALTTRGIYAELREHPPSPVYPQRFARIPGLTAADSQTIHDQLLAGGFLNAADCLTSNPTNDAWQNVLSSAYRPWFLDISAQLYCCYSEHQFYSDYGNKVLQFFGAQRPPLPGRTSIAAITRQTNGVLQLTIAADAGQTYRLQTSSDFTSWTNACTNRYVGGTFDVVDPLPLSPRFYRVASP
jgi:hypothetical protein